MLSAEHPIVTVTHKLRAGGEWIVEALENPSPLSLWNAN